MRVVQFLLIWLLGSLVLIAAVPRLAQSEEVSPAIREACDADVRALCPREYRARNGAAIGRCMKAQPSSRISWTCKAAWIKEHGLSK